MSMRDIKARNICLLLLMLFAFSVPTKGQTSKSTPTISLTIRATRDSARIGAPIIIKVNLKNISDHDVQLVMENGGKDSGLEVRDAHGKLVPDTVLGSVWNGHPQSKIPQEVPMHDLEGQLLFGVLKPEDTETWEVDANKFYQIREPGKYVIQVCRVDPDNAGVVRSNKLTITVTPRL